jgi:cytidylate kinase
MKTSSPLGDQFQRARRHWSHQAVPDEKLGKAAPVPFSVAISREERSLGLEVAQQLGQLLDWPVYDRQLLEQISDQTGLRTELLESTDERKTSWIIDSLEAFAQSTHVSSAAYVHHLAKVLAALSAHGRCVIVGRGAVAVLPISRTFRVRIVATPKDRIARVRDELGLTERKARRQLDTIDMERRQFVKNHFQKDVTDPHLYDLVLNTSRIVPRDCARLIEEGLKLRQRVAEEAVS